VYSTIWRAPAKQFIVEKRQTIVCPAVAHGHALLERQWCGMAMMILVPWDLGRA